MNRLNVQMKLGLKLIFAVWLTAAAGLGTPASRAQDAVAKVPQKVPVYQPKYYPYENGETASYKASWNGIPVATADVQTTPIAIDGKKFYRVRIDARTSRGLDLIWKMRDTISSVFDAQSLSPSRFVFSQRENSRAIDTEAQFNHQTNQWAINRYQEGRKPRVYGFDSKNTLDPITAVYLARSVDLKVGEKLFFDVFGGRHRYLLELAVEKKEPVALASGAVVEAFKIVPKLTNLTDKGYASRMNDAAIWISADERRMPVKLWSKIFVGTVQMELVQDKVGVRAAGAADSPRPAS